MKVTFVTDPPDIMSDLRRYREICYYNLVVSNLMPEKPRTMVSNSNDPNLGRQLLSVQLADL